MPKNITLAIDEDLLDKVRVLAAMKRTSVNELVRSYLQRLVDQEKEHDDAREELLRLMDESDGDLGSASPSREAIYSGEPRFDRWR
jgi:Arc/MetJ-type ribon-helix-helix transcriptional regulator